MSGREVYDMILVGGKALIFGQDAVDRLYSRYFIGKPFGEKKPRPGERYRGPLELTMLEALYLCEKGLARPYIGHRESGCRELREYAISKDPRFPQTYLVFRDLRERGFVVRSGMKYGVDFTVYERGPGLEHAPYLVHVFRHDEYIDPIHIVRLGRLSHSVRKTFVAAIVYGDSDIRYISFGWIKF